MRAALRDQRPRRRGAGLTAPTPLLLLGAGGLARETAAAVAASRTAGGAMEVAGFLDDDERLHGQSIGGVPVVGPLAAVTDHPSAHVVACIANPTSWWQRQTVVDRLDLELDRFATVVHPGASIGERTRIGAGSIVLASVVTTCDVEIGRHVAVMPATVLTHDCAIGDHATLASGVLLGGGTRVGAGAYVAAGVIVREGIEIGELAQVGAASLVLRDVPPREVWWGTPARFQRRSEAPGELDGAAPA